MAAEIVGEAPVGSSTVATGCSDAEDSSGTSDADERRVGSPAAEESGSTGTCAGEELESSPQAIKLRAKGKARRKFFITIKNLKF